MNSVHKNTHHMQENTCQQVHKGTPVLIQCRFPFCKMKLIVILLPLIILEGKYFLMIPLVSKSCAGITGLTTNDVEKVIRKSRSVVRGPRLATMLRLTFHDCVGITLVSLHHCQCQTHLYLLMCGTQEAVMAASMWRTPLTMGWQISLLI